MTENEAINFFKDFIETLKINGEEQVLKNNYCKSANIAIHALEKQIPKKPNLEGDGYADGQLVYDTWICPCCEKHYEVDYDDYDFCPNCGQAIDWSDED